MSSGSRLHESRFRGFLVHVLPAVLYVTGIFYLGSIPLPSIPTVSVIGTDKLVHAAAFFGMAWLFFRAAQYRWGSKPRKVLSLASAMGSFAVGGLLELHQMSIPGRSAELLDWIADGVGAMLAVVGLALAERRKWV